MPVDVLILSHRPFLATETTCDDLLEEYERYVHNDIPIRLIYIPEMKLVEKQFILDHFLPALQRSLPSDGKALPNRYCLSKMIHDLVKYAVFSHRWGRGEPSYHDFRSSMYLGTFDEVMIPGYGKLLRFCEEAKRRGIEFAWTDTCCIDKSSSADIAESIRSMYRWYKNSALCIVHLAGTEIMHDMYADEWFRRGWTLQELLAPPQMKFFNRHWLQLTDDENDKTDDADDPATLETRAPSMLDAIAQITRIDKSSLLDFHPSARQVDQRMTWAAHRRSTRDEDVAYCLMGIFGVNLQIAYGEGRDAAFCRLVEAIMLSGGDPSVLNWSGKAARHPASRCLPANPASYAGHPPLHSDAHRFLPSVCRLDMTLTGRGLRVTLVLLPLTHPSFDAASEIVKFRCEGSEASGDIFSVNVDFSGYRRQHMDGRSDYALGLTPYALPDDGSGLLRLVKPFTGFLLCSKYDLGWRRVDTPFVKVKLAPARRRDSRDSQGGRVLWVTVDKRHLRTLVL
ncbi:hypothetical protein CONPUDRAFT_152641 [Coniophora puteana RWD-64-598 SS2]|uniref:Heterokaryon incompatibility domain-containing protein n=1 Tax=Coniophora puteana (strain RWD-64-598) TaxID=741705 RepID=A0A5M3MRL6_CONPW|nr:uncharacterized protein CONPUDRAFT_152641 [Coniophora puteana RWD-64-598 SS2]EIW81730.1 hypothetical protein CONPUDRAFT_152641 [Coniophora puteana RWD-64-598 SS2]